MVRVTATIMKILMNKNINSPLDIFKNKDEIITIMLKGITDK